MLEHIELIFTDLEQMLMKLLPKEKITLPARIL